MAEVLVQSYSESNFTINFSVYNGGFGNERIGAPFKGDGTAISRVVFYLSKTGSPTGNAHVRIYDLGVQAAPNYHDTVPGGSALAESDAVDVSTIAGSSSLIEFSFSGSNRILLTDDNYYAAILEYDDAGSSSSDRLNFGTDGTPADGTSVDRELYIIRYRDNEADWSSTVAYDPIYYIYGEEVETNTYYFDGHSGISDPDSVWTNDANAFDGSTATIASSGIPVSTSSGYLLGIGTNAPGSGANIVSVRARSYGFRATTGGAYIYSSGLAENLGVAQLPISTGWGSYVTLSTPSGGWSWTGLQDLETKLVGGDAQEFAKIELEVTSVAPDTTTTAITKDLAYAVLTTPTTTQKSLAYFIKRDDLIQKNIAYAVTDTNLVQKTLAYLVAATPAAITKSLGYMVRSTPSAVTKSVQYMVAATPAALTKALTYGVDIVASPSNIFSPAVGGFMVGQFWTASASSTLTEVITKTLEYAIGAGATITKSLAYVVAGSDTITKNVTYAVLSNALIQKSVAYTVQTFDSLTKTLQYIIKSSPTLTKGMTYVVLTANTIQKGLSYTILSAEAITKSLTYAVLHPATITKSIAYAIIKTPTAITKLFTYSVVGESAIIQKTLSYRVVMADTIQKSINYAVQASQSITKSLTYYLTSTTYTITKGLEYRVKPVSTIAKALVYAVITTPSTLTKSISYQVVTNDTIQKGLTYIVEFTTAIEKNLEYLVITTPTTMTKAMAYFIGRPISITKSLAYRIKNRYPKPPTMTVEAVQSRWLQVKNQKPPKTIVE